jgi:uncharacterized membrane protein
MPNSNFGGSFLVGIVYVALIMVLVRNGSQGPTAIKNVADGLANIVSAATGTAAAASG